MSKRAVFLDRDGTLIEDVGFVRRVEDVKLLPEAAEAVSRLNHAGWAVIVVTNQSGVARGLLTEADVAATNQRMMDLLAKKDARVDAIYYCPHLPEGKVPDYAVVCNCRKPRPGMILKAAEDFGIDLGASVMIGDAPRDVEAGLAAGARAILLTKSAVRADRAPDACGQAADLTAAVDEILHLADAADVAQPPSAVPKAKDDAQAGAPVPHQQEAAVESQAEPPAKPEREIPVHAAAKEFVPEPDGDAPPVEEKKKPKLRVEEKPVPAVKAESMKETPAPPGAAVPDLPKPAPTPEPQQPSQPRAAVPHQHAPEAACGRCGREVRAEDVAAGRAFCRDGVSLCEVCASAVATRRRAADKDAVAASSDAILRELADIKRALSFRPFSLWHVLGSVAQAIAVGSVIIGYATGNGPTGLLWAIFAQLLALTMFVLGRM